MPQPAVFLAILFADISGSTRLYETLGDALARQRVSECLAILSAEIRRHGGTVVKTIGDEVMSTFPNAEATVNAACAMQEALTTSKTAPGQTPLAIRVGLHYGPVLMEEGDVFGDAVNVAARMVSLAKAGQIITTVQTVTTLAPETRASTRCIDRAPVKGKQEELDIYEVIWREDDLTRMEGNPIPPPAAQARLRLRFRDKEIELGQTRSAITIGRGPQNDLVVQDEFISRLHARIEYRRDKFILLDQSTNGTFVRTADGKVVGLRREEVSLQGTGMISLGRTFTEDSPYFIHFHCEP
jgi:class 3 adenylate cyclase